jgi:phthiocerol/phenolphthiocerol synthesis type-I polyketide synthase E
MSEADEHGTGLEIAIIGMAGRFPGAGDVEEFWRNLRDGVESLTVFTREELKRAGVSPELIRSPRFVPVARLVPDFDLFDAAFFGVSPREAEIIDPQQRMFLECCWTALEDAGQDPERCGGAVGVFAGARLSTYIMNVYSNPANIRSIGDIPIQVANDKDYLATRISYKLNLGGPSLTVQTACSTALVAVHLGCQALLSGECDMALAGAVAVRLSDHGYVSTDGDPNSPDGHVRTFDARAGGTVFGNGLGVVVLKRLADALADGDCIRAVIRGSAVTNDGSQKVGFTAPGVDGQVRVLRAALATAEVDPATITYVEAHGTGTPVGDPIEVTALTRVYREWTDARQYCALASAKTNIGHLGGAAGIAGLIKATLALQHRQIPPSLFFEEANPQIDFASSPFFVNTRLLDWTPPDGTPRRAGVSAFGMGGTNAHVILEEAPEPGAADPSRPWQVLLLSARSESALATLTSDLAAFLDAHPEVSLPDAAFTLQVGRRVHEHRRALVCRDAEHAREVLRELPAELVSTAFSPGRRKTVAFLFSGQGSQYVGMGKGLYETEPTFREQIDLCCERLGPHLGLDLRELLFADAGDAAAAAQLGQTRFTQPALFVVEIALARLWMEWGIVPQALLGHSIGEYVAACLAGVFSLDDALALVAERGRLMQGLPSGAMLAVPLREAEVAPLLDSRLSLAAVNAPDRCVVSGPQQAVEALRARLEARGVAARPLHTSHAFHSGMMEPILEPFLQRLAGIELHPPKIPCVSNVTGAWITAAEATDPGYWARHLRQAVRFADGVRELCRDPQAVLLEVGPGQSLATLARQHPDRGTGRVILSSLRHPKDRQEDLPVLLKTLGQLWIAGVEPDWKGFYARERRRRIPLPTYPFERRRFWIEAARGGALLTGAPAGLGKKEDIADWFYVPYWKPSVPPSPSPEAEEASSRWLVFLDADGVGEAAVARLEAGGRSVVAVSAGSTFRRSGGGRYEIAPGRREDYDALLEDLAAEGGVPGRVLHLWNVGPAGDGSEEDLCERSFWSLLFLAQALGKASATRPLHVAVVSSRLQNVAGGERLLPERALLLGPAKVIPQEYPNLRCVSVDIELPAGDRMVERLIAEATAEPSGVVAWRGGRRWVQAYEAVRLETPAARSLPFRERGVYLLTGGLGGLGLTFAELLAREHRARLVLLGTSALPDRDAWEDWLRTHDEADRTSRRIRKVRELEALGAEVLVAGVDVADRERMRTVVEDALARFGTIHGVIHAAGVPGGGMIQLKTAEMAQRVLSPKVAGTRALMDAVAGLPLDFVALCSSTIAVAGGLGQVDYCAANNFLDAFAHASALAGAPRVLSINWGAWEEVGMAVAAGLLPARSEAPEPSPEPPPVVEGIHPLLDRRVPEETGRSVYATDFSPARHWVLNEHRIMGTPALPGTTHLELARAAFLHHAAAAGHPVDGGVELRDVLFFSPLLLSGGHREVRVTLEGDGDSCDFQVTSRAEPSWQPHARGKVAALPRSAGPERLDLSEILARCGEEVEIDESGVATGEKLVSWGPHWQSLKKIHLGRGEALARIEMPEELAGEVAQYGLHPALLDVATALASAIERESFLPLSYGRVRVHRPMPPRFLSHLRKQGDASGTETLAVDVRIVSESGEVLVEIDHFAMKRVGQAAETLKRAEPSLPPEPADAADAGESSGILPREGAEALRRMLSRDLDLPQIAATARDLHAMIAQASALRSTLELGGAAGPAAAIHARPNIATPYVAPATELERRLAAVWQATLGIEEVGVDDNFFDLGGDSILGIQLVARANESGLQLAPDQLFEHQTIAELARVAGFGQEREAAVEELLLPVTPHQRELLEAGPDAPCWFAVWALPAETPAPADVLREAVERVVARHDALRTRFSRGPEGWTQAPADLPEPVLVAEVDLQEAEGEAAVALAADELRAGLAPEQGALVAAAVLREGEGSPVRALLVTHPAAVDRASWQLLRDEVRSACRQLAAGGEVELPPPGTPFHRWLAGRLDKARGTDLPPEVAAWRVGLEDAPPLPASSPVASVSLRLDGEDTRALLEEIPDLQRIRAEELILAALARTLCRACGAHAATCEIEVDAREADALDLDLSRTVGCFTIAVPVRLEPVGPAEPEGELRAIKEQIRSGTRAGLGSVWRHGLPDLPQAAVSFVDLGDAQVTGGKARGGAALTVTAQLDGEGLRLDWKGAAAEILAGDFLDVLRSLIASCRSLGLALYTPSDFPDAELSQEDLDKIFSKGVS